MESIPQPTRSRTPHFFLQPTNKQTVSGGYEPGAVCCALHDALGMDWRKGSTKVVILVTDEPPHGLSKLGDSFPKGCPDGHDPIETAHEMAEQGISLYTVGCEPWLS